MRWIQEVLRLKHEGGLSVREIARSLGRSYGVVAKYLQAAERAGIGWPLPEGMGEQELQERLFPERKPRGPSRPLPDMAEVHQELVRHKGMTLELAWREYRAVHPDGYGLTQFCDYYRRWRDTGDVVLRQRHAAGEKIFVDWAGPTVPWTDPQTGAVQHASLFVAVLGASNYTFCRAYPNQQVASWLDAHAQAFVFFGGVSRAVVPDNPKTGIKRASYYEPELHPTYQELAEHFGVAILPARVRRPRDKAKVETAVQIAERRILAPLRHHQFFSVGEINEAIRPLLHELNEQPFQKMAGSRRSWFEELDRPALQPLPAEPYELAEWRKAIVNIDHHVQVDWHFYSVPFQLVKHEVDVRLAASTVQVFHQGKRVALHVRSHVRGAFTTDTAHQPKAHQRHGGTTPGQLIQRARALGPAVAQVAACIIETRPHPEQGYRAVLGILRLGRDYGDERLDQACRRAQALDCQTYRSIASILKRGLDREPLPGAPPPPPLAHANIRGSAYYQTALPLGLEGEHA